MTSAGSKHNLDASWFDRVVHLDVVVVFLLELEQAAIDTIKYVKDNSELVMILTGQRRRSH